MSAIDTKIEELKTKLDEAHVEKIALRNKERELREAIIKLKAVRDSAADENYVGGITSAFESDG